MHGYWSLALTSVSYTLECLNECRPCLITLIYSNLKNEVNECQQCMIFCKRVKYEFLRCLFSRRWITHIHTLTLFLDIHKKKRQTFA